jgi:hypothetical protein
MSKPRSSEKSAASGKTSIFNHIDTAIVIDDDDASRNRNNKVSRATENAVACCKEL